jgi:hypothetical protein
MTPPNSDGDLSERAVRIARIIDRLPPGTYNIELLKPEIKAASWKVIVERLEFIQKAALARNGSNGLDTD